MIEVKSFTDRNGKKVVIGDMIGHLHGKRKGRVIRITKAGYHISAYIEGEKHPWFMPWIEKLPEASNTTESAQPKAVAE